jgi:hypothetical protein
MEFEGEHKNKVDTSDCGGFFVLYVTLKALSRTDISVTDLTVTFNTLELMPFHNSDADAQYKTTLI